MPTDAQRRNLASAHHAEVLKLNERIALLEQQLAEARMDALAAFDAAVESARLLGGSDAKRGLGCYTDQDSRFVRCMHESIAKHRAAITSTQEQT